MDLKKLLESLDSMAEDAILDKPHSSKRFTDQVSGTDKARHISVLGNPAGDPKHPFQGKLVGGCAEADQHLDEDLIQQLTREFAEFLKNPTVVDEAGISDTQKTGPLAPVAGKPAAASSVSESSKKRCMQCGMKNCTCEQGKCKCKPIAGWIPNKGFKKTTEQVVDEAKSSKLLTRAQLNDTPEKRKQQGRCVSCGQSLSTAGRGTADRCKECSADDSQHG